MYELVATLMIINLLITWRLYVLLTALEERINRKLDMLDKDGVLKDE